MTLEELKTKLQDLDDAEDRIMIMKLIKLYNLANHSNKVTSRADALAK